MAKQQRTYILPRSALTWTPGISVVQPRPFPRGKKDREKYVAREFAKAAAGIGVRLTDIRSSPDDSHGGPDVLAKLVDQEIGIQLTELKVAHGPNSRRVANRIVEKLIDEILREIDPPSVRLRIRIESPMDHQNQVVKLSKKSEIRQLAKVIVEAIRSEEFSRRSLSAPRDSKDLTITPPAALQDKISSFTITPLPDDCDTGAPGRDNICVDFPFLGVSFSDSCLEKLVEKAVQDKGGSSADILLVWCKDPAFWGEGKKTTQMLKEHLDRLKPPGVYLLTFDNPDCVPSLFTVR